MSETLFVAGDKVKVTPGYGGLTATLAGLGDATYVVADVRGALEGAQHPQRLSLRGPDGELVTYNGEGGPGLPTPGSVKYFCGIWFVLAQ